MAWTIRAGVTAVIDGIEGCVIIDPSEETILEYEARRDAVARERRGLARLRRLPAITRQPFNQRRHRFVVRQRTGL